ncbi:hypothetical protein Q8F55_006547 [Vanrija albida]|uniref:Uncharacterized protein n=1 Tax=Vanrija albida TaxID=181172 RepID=A0ABR3PYD4_9TREE
MPAILLINGFPGIGKRAVAHELVPLLPDARVLDTRAAHHPEPHAALLEAVVRVLDSPAAPHTLAIPVFLSVRRADRAALLELASLASTAGWAFVHVILCASTEAHVARAAAAGRASEDDLLLLRMEEEVAALAPCPDLTAELELDTTCLDARATAAVLAQYCDTLRREVCVQARPRP